MGSSALSAITFRARRRLAASSWLALAIVLTVGVVLGSVLLVAAGAARTAAAPDVYERRHDPGDVAQVMQYTGASDADRISRLPGVLGATSITFIMAGVDPGSDQVIAFAGTPLTAITQGRPAERSDEFVSSESFVVNNGVAIGQQFTFVSLTEEQAAQFGFDIGEPEGPTFTATLVGTYPSTADGDPTRPGDEVIVFPNSVLRTGDIAIRSTVLRVDLAPGLTDDDLQRTIGTLEDAANFTVVPSDLVSPSVRTSVRTMANALWIVSAVAAAAALATLGQFVTRRVRLHDDERQSLSAIGMSRRQIALESTVVAALPLLAGTLLAIVIAALGSGRFPFGFVRPLDPTGFHFDGPVLLGGAAIAYGAILLWVAVAFLAARARRAASVGRWLEQATASLPAPLATGTRFAFGPAPTANGSTRAAFLGIAIATAGIVGAVTTGSSLDRLNSDRARYGMIFDLTPGDSGQTTAPEAARNALLDDPEVTSLADLAASQAQIGDATIALVAWSQLRGEAPVYAVEGRVPTADDEIMIGRRTARSLDIRIGDDLPLSLGDRAVTYRVTGFAPILGFGGNNGVGEDAMLTLDGLRRIDPEIVATGLGVNAPAAAIDRIRTELKIDDQSGYGSIPTAIVNLRRVDAVPYLLASLLVLAGALTVGHTMLMAVRHRRRDLAVLRALGADRRWTTSVVHTQSTVFSLAAIVLGIPFGLLLGRVVFVALANSIGVDNRPSLPFGWVVLAGIALMLLANVVTIGPALRARRADVVVALAGE